jgi:hypothetical protein
MRWKNAVLLTAWAGESQLPGGFDRPVPAKFAIGLKQHK